MKPVAICFSVASSARFSSREILGWLAMSRPVSGARPQAIMSAGSLRNASRSSASSIFKTYDADAIPLVKENPYRLARDIRGIGFKTADALAARLGIPKDSMLRARAGLSYALLQAVEKGDCALTETGLLKLAEKLLEIGQRTLIDALDLETAKDNVVRETIEARPCVFLPHLRNAEETVLGHSPACGW